MPMSAMREELHHLVDQLPEAELRPALELIRGRVAEHAGPGRDLPFFASFEAEPCKAKTNPESGQLSKPDLTSDLLKLCQRVPRSARKSSHDSSRDWFPRRPVWLAGPGRTRSLVCDVLGCGPARARVRMHRWWVRSLGALPMRAAWWQKRYGRVMNGSLLADERAEDETIGPWRRLRRYMASLVWCWALPQQRARRLGAGRR